MALRIPDDSGWQDEFRLRPRIGRRPGPQTRSHKTQLLKRLARAGTALRRATRARGGTEQTAPLAPKLSRRAIVKARYVRTSPRSAKAAALHLAYIEREGV